MSGYVDYATTILYIVDRAQRSLEAYAKSLNDVGISTPVRMWALEADLRGIEHAAKKIVEDE